MFKVHRFTADSDEHGEGLSGGGDNHKNSTTSILDRVLERAKARASKAKRARLGKDEGIQPLGGAVDSGAAASVLAPGKEVVVSAGGHGEGFTTAAALVCAASGKDRTAAGRRAAAVQQENRNTSEEGSSEEEEEEEEEEEGGEEGSSSGEDVAESRDHDDSSSSGVEKDAEMRTTEAASAAETARATTQASAAAAGAAVAAAATAGDGGEGLRPMEEVAEEWGLDSRLAGTLREEGVKHFFPIQVRVVPDIVATERHSHVQSRDICVSAPTGSGKTLVFVLGVLQALIRRRVVRLRALVLLPSRDLAMQVHAVFKRYARGTGLRVGLAIGQTNFLEEQLSLVGAVALAGNPVATARASFLRAQGRHTGPDPTNGGSNFDWSTGGAPAGGSSEVDIVVATPGRLLDHLAQTPGFTLQHLRYLVIDEADRLLNQSYQGWVGKVVQAAYRRDPGKAAPVYEENVTRTETPLADLDGGGDQDSGVAATATDSSSYSNSSSSTSSSNGRKRSRSSGRVDGKQNKNENQTKAIELELGRKIGNRKSGDNYCRATFSRQPSAVLLEPVTVRGRPLATGDRVMGATVSTPPLRKLLFSATLTNNPQKLAGLGVVNPLIYTAREKTATSRTAAAGSAAGLDIRGEGDGGDGSAATASAAANRPSQETRRSSTLDEIAEGGGTGEGRFSTPATLDETYTVCDSQAKPLVLLSLLRAMVASGQTQLAVVFASSVDSTHRLFRLLQLFGGFAGAFAIAAAEGGVGGDDHLPTEDMIHEDPDSTDGGVAEFSSSLGQRQRSHIIRRARAGAVRVIVCSDGMARGMDLDGVGLVVNYDVPSQPKTYVHRVGRTARAGSRGVAVTIAKKGQVKQFIRMRASVDRKRVRLDSSSTDQSRLLEIAGRYQRCLKDLKEVLEAERAGELDPSAPVTATESYQ